MTTPNLPAPLGGPDGTLDLEALRGLSPQVRTGLTAALRHAATLAREARGTVVVPEDTFALTRSLTDAGEVLRTWRDAFEAAAKEADALLEEEALAAVGGLPGYEEAPSGSHFVPDGEGQRIAITPKWKTGATTWDTTTLVNWVVDQEAENMTAAGEDGCTCLPYAAGGDGPEKDCARHGDPVTVGRELAAAVVERLLMLGTYSPGAAKIEAERKRLAGLQRDSDAAVLRQVRTVAPRQYEGVKITREAAK